MALEAERLDLEPKLRPTRSLNAYLLLLVFVALMPVLIIAGIVVFEAASTFRSSSLQRLSDTVVPLSRAVEGQLTRGKEIVTLLASRDQTTGRDELDPGEQWVVNDLGGAIVWEDVPATSAAMPQTGVSSAGLPFEAIHRSLWTNTVAVSNLYSARQDQSPRFALVVSQPAQTGRVRVVGLIVDPARMIYLLEQSGSETTSLLVAVTDGSGKLVARSRGDRQLIGKPVPDWAKLKALKTDHGSFDAVTKEGGKVIFSFLQLRDTPGWVVVVGEPLESFNARWLRPIIEIVAGSLAAILLALAMGIWVSRRFLGPVRVLARHADEVASGYDTAAPLTPFAIEEFESLRASLAKAEETLRERMLAEKLAAHRLSSSERRYRTLAEAGAMVFWLCDWRGNLLSATGWKDLTGVEEQDALGKRWTASVHPDDMAVMDHAWNSGARAKGYVDQEFRVRTAAGQWRWVRVRGSLVEGDAEMQWVGVLEDVDARRRAQARIAHMAHHDSLTGLGNRVLLRERLAVAVADDDASGAVLLIDLDRFKTVNDTLGHSHGDELLTEVAKRIIECLSSNDFVARLGGDEFAIVHEAGGGSRAIEALCRSLVKRLGEPYFVGDVSVVVGASIGVAMFDGASAELMMQKADIALYEAKSAGRGVYRFFEPGMDEKVQQRGRLERELREAIRGHQLEVYYQPLVNPSTRRLTGFEALLRWNHPTRGLLSPIEFIPIAEETGLIVPIGEMVLREACSQATSWPEHLKVSTNISPIQLANKRLVETVTGALQATGLPARRLELEITENALITNIESAMGALLRLKALGCGIVMDDFGSGGSSLSYLKAFPFTRVKIDKSFTLNLDLGRENKAIVRAVTSICESLGITSTAEGVETEEQLAFVKAEQCAEVQGFLFGKPGPAHEVPAVIERLGGSTKAGGIAAVLPFKSKNS